MLLCMIMMIIVKGLVSIGNNGRLEWEANMSLWSNGTCGCPQSYGEKVWDGTNISGRSVGHIYYVSLTLTFSNLNEILCMCLQQGDLIE